MTLLLIHGAGCTRDVFINQVDALPDAYAMNLPGHDAPGSAETISEFGDAVCDYVRDNALNDVILCGNSMGGAIALDLALRPVPWLRALIVIGSGAKLRVSADILEGLRNDFDAMAQELARYFYADPTPERVAFSTALMERVGGAQTLADFRACDGFDVVDRLGELCIPVLAFTGADDVMTPPAYTRLFGDRVRGAQTRILPGVGHFPMLEDAHATNELIRTFVSSLASTRKENTP